MKAPIQLHVLAKLLGEARADAFTLCSSPNINPYSLIKPTYVEAADFVHVGKGPENLAGDSWPDLDVKVKTGHGIGVGAYTWKQCRFGYYAPYCGTFDNFIDMCDVPWVHVGCEKADTAKNGGVASWAHLTMFDGYLHDAVPINPVQSAIVAPERAISVNLLFTEYTDPIKLKDPSATQYPGNPGGAVSPAAILGMSDEKCVRYVGAALYKKNGEKWEMKANKAHTSPMTADKANVGVGLQLLASPEVPATYRIIPWIIEMDQTTTTQIKMPFYYDGDGKAVANAGARIFSFKVHETYVPEIEKSISRYWPDIYIQSASIDTTSGKVSVTVRIKARSIVGTPDIRVSNIRVNLTITGTSLGDLTESPLPKIEKTITTLTYKTVGISEVEDVVLTGTLDVGNLKSYKRAMLTAYADATVVSTGTTTESPLQSSEVDHDLTSNTSNNAGEGGTPLLPGSGWGPIIWPST